MNNTLDEKIIKRIPLEILALSFILALGAAILFDPLTGVFVLAGGLLAAVGFNWLKQSVYKFLMSEKKSAVRSAILLYILRLVLIIAVFFIIIFFFSNRIFGFIAGFSTLILVFLIEAVTALSKLKQWKS